MAATSSTSCESPEKDVYDKAGMFNRDQRRLAKPVVPALGPTQAVELPIPCSESEREVVWNGVFRGFSGYAKANREIALRVANTIRVSVVEAIDPRDYDDYGLQRIHLHRRVAVSKHAPQVRFFGPANYEKEDRFRVIYTMMETEKVHASMIELMNTLYHEVWTPTWWNALAFKRSGLEVPVRVMPLGVNPHVYRPGMRAELPPCELLSTRRAGEAEVPKGFLFVYCFLPSFRKGLDVLLPAFEEAFAGDPDVALVLAVTHRPSFLEDPDLDKPKTSYSSRIYTLTGNYTERDMARIYRACNAYVTSSRGEGWNLPMCEAAACGLPVIAPRNTAHAEILDDSTGYLFDTEGTAVWEQGQKVSPWYDGATFSVFGKRSHAELVQHLRTVRAGGVQVEERAAKFCDQVRSKHTWDRAAAHVVERLLEITA
jgi:glycosyltransferase involved in cell wall biosynthesis